MSNQEFQKLKALYFSEIRKLRAELEERRMSTPTMNALHVVTLERDQALADCKALAEAIELSNSSRSTKPTDEVLTPERRERHLK